VVVVVPDRFGTGRPGGNVIGGSGPAPSGSMTFVGAVSDVVVALVVSVELVVSVGEGSVVVVVVVGVVVLGVVVLGRVSTFVRGTQVYSGSGMKPGGTTWAVSGAAGVGAGGW
jgi:hypothetical protein